MKNESFVRFPITLKQLISNQFVFREFIHLTNCARLDYERVAPCLFFSFIFF